jgi:hypothetical protein
MTTPSEPLVRTVRGVRCLPVPEQAGRWWFLPLPPIPGRTPAGEPNVMLVELGDAAILQLEARLGPPDDELDVLRGELAAALAAEGGDAGPGPIRLDPAPVTVDAAELRLAPDRGRDAVVVRSRTSGYPPQVALFNVRLDAAQRSAVSSALAGRSGLLTIAYCGLALSASTSRRSATTWSSSSSTTVTTEVRSGHGPSVRSTHAEHVTDSDHDTTSPVPAARPPVPDLVADVASWFMNGRGLEHVLLAPASAPTDNPTNPPESRGDLAP